MDVSFLRLVWFPALCSAKSAGGIVKETIEDRISHGSASVEEGGSHVVGFFVRKFFLGKFLMVRSVFFHAICCIVACMHTNDYAPTCWACGLVWLNLLGVPSRPFFVNLLFMCKHGVGSCVYFAHA